MNTVAEDPVTLAYHELRAPLALVATLAKSAAADCSDEMLISRCLSIARTAERMLDTANTLLTFAGTVHEAPRQAFRPADVVTSVVRDYQAIGVNIFLHEDVTSLAEVYGVSAYLEALTASLIGNAVSHGDLSRPIEVDMQCAGGLFEVRLTNTLGNGRHHGLGLGTYIADRLVRELSGTLSCRKSEEAYFAVLRIPVATVEACISRNSW